MAKIKMKTNRAAAKRFRITGGGHLRRRKSGHKHGMFNKSRKRNRRLGQSDTVHGDIEKRLKLLLPYA